MESTHLTIVTPMGNIFDGDIKSVTLPGSEGEFGVLPQHVGLVTTLEPGVIELVTIDGRHESVAIKWGGVTVSETQVDVLVDEAVAIRGESESEIAKAIDEAKALLNEIKDSDAMIASVEAKIDSAAQRML